MQYLVLTIYFFTLFFLGRKLLGGYSESGYKIAIRNIIWFSAIFYVTYFVGLRPSTDFGDTFRYVWTYNRLTALSEAQYDGQLLYGNTEWLFWPLSYVFKFIGFGPQAWLVGMVILPAVILTYCYRKLIKSDDWVYVFAAIYLSYYLVFSLAMRQAMAESLVILSLVFSVEKKVKLSILMSLLALGFHQSAAIALLFPFLVNIKFTPRMLMGACLAAIFFSTVASSYMLNTFQYLGLDSAINKLTEYSYDAKEFDNLFYHAQFLLLFFVSLLYLYVEREKQRGIYSFVVYVFFLIFFFWSMPVMSGRMMGYVTVVFPIMLYYILKSFFNAENAFYLFITFFGMLGFLVISTESTRLVLGLP